MSNEKTQLYAGKPDESGTTGNGENVSSADNQQGRTSKTKFVVDLEGIIPFGNGVVNRSVEIKASSRDEAEIQATRGWELAWLLVNIHATNVTQLI